MALSNTVLSERMALSEPENFLGLVTLNRPEQRNPLDWDVIKGLRAAVDELSADSSVRVVAFIGAGDAFSAGGDLKKYLSLQKSSADFRAFLEDLHGLFNFIQFDMPKPAMALINGVTAAGGLELALSCDVVYAAAGARIGDGHLNFGQMGGGGVLTRLPRTVFQNFGREILFTGEFLQPEAWQQAGLVTRILPDRDALVKAAVSFATRVAQKSPLAVANMKQIANRGREMRFHDTIAEEIEVTHNYCLNSHDSTEGLVAFSEKRRPRFSGS